MKNHAKNERDLAKLVAQETLEDLYGGTMKRHNGPGLLAGLVFLLIVLGLPLAGVIWMVVH